MIGDFTAKAMSLKLRGPMRGVTESRGSAVAPTACSIGDNMQVTLVTSFKGGKKLEMHVVTGIAVEAQALAVRNCGSSIACCRSLLPCCRLVAPTEGTASHELASVPVLPYLHKSDFEGLRGTQIH
jgi:hypothetical protein